MIAFDLFGVIIEEGHLIQNALKPLLPREVDQDRVKPLYNDFNINQISEQEFWSGIGIDAFQTIREDFLNTFTLDPGFDQVIDALQQRYRLAILSNLPSDWADALVEKFELARWFAPMCFSGHLEHKKPQPDIYQSLMQQSQLTADRIVFIDDRLENLQAATAAGMATIYVQREVESVDYRPDATISELAQVLDWV